MESWEVREDIFCAANVRKYESIFCQGNGYMGIRAAVEEDYPKNNRYTLVAGTFDRMEEKNTTELPNSADVMAANITADGITLGLNGENVKNYGRSLNVKNGVLKRQFIWIPKEGVEIAFASERFVSINDLHAVGQRISIKVIKGSAKVEIGTGVSGDERPGEPHFQPIKARAKDNILQYAEKTHESNITFITSASVGMMYIKSSDCEAGFIEPEYEVTENGVMANGVAGLDEGDEIIIEKLCRIATTRDYDFDKEKISDTDSFLKREAELMRRMMIRGYAAALLDSEKCWDKIWMENDIKIVSRNSEYTDKDGTVGHLTDQLAYRLAVYHLIIMAPVHDRRMNIGAKGLSGKGYQGHSFWDTEIYILPYFVWKNPRGARSLLEYRYMCLDSAKEKARQNGYEGAMYPWEAAWITDVEVCPEMRFAQYEQHITADVAYAVCYYYDITGDMDFMIRYGCEILFETADFWKSRLEFSSQNNRYEIRDVIGPDEFTHHADNNAYTNYLAHLNLKQAVLWKDRLEKDNPAEYGRLNSRLNLDKKAEQWNEKADMLYLPQINEENILPQDDKYLTLPEINIDIYRAGQKKLRTDYPYPQYVDLKVSKQADVVSLMLLMGDMFSDKEKSDNLSYYEPLCVHESSLSLCAYSVLAAQCKEKKKAYELFERAKNIDFGSNMSSSNDGIHAASLGGLWQCYVLGFMGIYSEAGELKAKPNLPAGWESATLFIRWRGKQYEVTAERDKAHISECSKS